MARTQKPTGGARCNWMADEDGNWVTACGEMHVLIDGGPVDNRMRFCCYCGAPLWEMHLRSSRARPKTGRS